MVIIGDGVPVSLHNNDIGKLIIPILMSKFFALFLSLYSLAAVVLECEHVRIISLRSVGPLFKGLILKRK